jgi:3-oxoacyl-[acyl-carrier protein] reductase
VTWTVDLATEASAAIFGATAVVAEDITAPDAPERLVQRAIHTFGRIDVIVNNAGYTLDSAVHKMSDSWFQRMLDIHLIAPFRLVRAAAPHLREPAKSELARGEVVYRRVVNVTSVSGTMGNAGQANYSSAKSGLVGLTKTLAKEWGSSR